MAINFIKNIHDNAVDDNAHKKFIRYSLGEFEREEMKIKVTKNIKIIAGFEYLDTMFHLLSEVVKEDVELSGTIVSKSDILGELSEFGIEPTKVTGKKHIIKATLTSDKFKDFVKVFSKYYLLLSVKSGTYDLKPGKSVPKPGKVVEKWLKATFEKTDLDLIKSEFLFDVKDDFKEAIVKHTYNIVDIEVPKEFENDPVQARLNAIRKGSIARLVTVDGSENSSEFDLAA